MIPVEDTLQPSLLVQPSARENRTYISIEEQVPEELSNQMLKFIEIHRKKIPIGIN